MPIGRSSNTGTNSNDKGIWLHQQRANMAHQHLINQLLSSRSAYKYKFRNQKGQPTDALTQQWDNEVERENQSCSVRSYGTIGSWSSGTTRERGPTFHDTEVLMLVRHYR
jgi:hypothetical protein